MTGSLPLWLTEYHTIIDNGGIQTDHLVDFQSGLVVADLLLTAMADGFGALVHPGAWDLRPAGITFGLLSAFAGERRVSVSVASPTATIVAGVGAIPSGMAYDQLEIIASKIPGGGVRMGILNRTYDETHRLRLKGIGPVTQATVHRYEGTDLFADNETTPGVVGVDTSSGGARDPFVISVSPRSLVRIDFQ